MESPNLRYASGRQEGAPSYACHRPGEPLAVPRQGWQSAANPRESRIRKPPEGSEGDGLAPVADTDPFEQPVLLKLLSLSSRDLGDVGLGQPGVDAGLHVGVAGDAAFDA